MSSESNFSRRQLLETGALAAGVAAAVAALPARARAASAIQVQPQDVILFQGDSITDARRDRKKESKFNHAPAMGYGYPLHIGSDLLRDHAKSGLKIYNRGISGNKVPDLQKRWQKDCLDLKPRVLSILIGVNDIWHKLGGRYDGTVQDYRDGFTELLKQTKAALPKTVIVVCEPFVLRCGAVNDKWFPEFDQRRAAAKEVAEWAEALWVPFQSMFDGAVAAGTDPRHWAGDGVHPSMAGHALMAQTWRQVVGL